MGDKSDKSRHSKRKDNDAAVPLSTLRKTQLIFEDEPKPQTRAPPEYRSYVPKRGSKASTSNVYGYFDPESSRRRPPPPSSDRTTADVDASRQRNKLSYDDDDSDSTSEYDDRAIVRGKAARKIELRRLREIADATATMQDIQNQVDALKMQVQTSERATIQDPRDQVATVEAPVGVPGKPSRWHRIPGCYILITLGMVVIAGSLAVGLYYSISQDRMGDGFTTAGFMVAVGTLILAAPTARHYPKCQCWGADEALLP